VYEGYIKKWRIEQEKAIWSKPPLHFKVWHYILYNVDSKGTLRQSLNQIGAGCFYIENRRIVTPHPTVVGRVVEQLEDDGMINCVDDVIIVNNWRKYQGEGEDDVPPREKPKKKKKGRSDLVMKPEQLYRKHIDSDLSFYRHTRHIIYSKARKHGLEMVEKAILWWKRELEKDAWKQDNLQHKGIQWWFQYKIDEIIKVMKVQEDHNPKYKEWRPEE